MLRRFEVKLPDESVIYGEVEVTPAVTLADQARGWANIKQITTIYHECPMAPDHNGVPVASHLTNLIAMAPAIIKRAEPFKELARRIVAGMK
jgi:hypothetical protein